MRTTILRVLLVAYFLASVAVAVPVAMGIDRAGELAGTTSGKILAAAIVALGLGALLAATDPRRHRVVVLMLMAFTTLSALAILSRVIGDEHRNDPAAVLLPFVAACPVVFAFLFPYGRGAGQTGGRSAVPADPCERYDGPGGGAGA